MSEPTCDIFYTSERDADVPDLTGGVLSLKFERAAQMDAWAEDDGPKDICLVVATDAHGSATTIVVPRAAFVAITGRPVKK